MNLSLYYATILSGGNMKLKTTRYGKTLTFTNEDAVGYDVWRNVGSYDSKKGTAKYFNGSWYKDILDGNSPRVFSSSSDAVKAILVAYNKAKEAKKEVVE